jgi:hypothetical protein
MNGYEPPTPRVALGLTAVAMAAITMSTLVVLPAKLDSVTADPHAPTATKSNKTAPIEVAIIPTLICVTGVIDREVHLDPVRMTIGAQESRGKCNPSS